MSEGQSCQQKRAHHRQALRCDHAAMPAIAIAYIPAYPRQQQHGHLACKPENSQQRRRAGLLVHQPLLRGVLHPRADQRDQLPNDE